MVRLQIGVSKKFRSKRPPDSRDATSTSSGISKSMASLPIPISSEASTHHHQDVALAHLEGTGINHPELADGLIAQKKVYLLSRACLKTISHEFEVVLLKCRN